jgi:raffinose/stachyose/melibiose transport system permease protein
MENFKEIFSDKRFLDSLFFTFKYTVLNVIFINILAFALALMLDRTVKGIGFLRSVFFMPNVISMVIVGFIWQFIFMNVVGEVSKFTGLSFLNQSWLGNPQKLMEHLIGANLYI